MTRPPTPAQAPAAGARRPPAPQTGADTARTRRRHPAGGPARDERGDYAVFIAVIAVSLLLLGGIAYDGPRLIAARQDAAHAAGEAARVAAVTIASGGTLHDAEEAAERRVAQTPLIYGERVDVARIECVGARVQVTVITGYRYRSALSVARFRQPIAATGAAEALLVLPGNQLSALHHLGECPLS